MSVHSWKVLAIDDELEILDNLEKMLSRNMGDNKFVFTKVTSFDEGMALVDTGKFDLVFLDVHDNAGDPDPSAAPDVEDQRGEDVLKHIQSVRFVPVIFYTGFSAKVAHLESLVVKVIDKGSNLDEVRAVVQEVLGTKLPHLTQYIEEQSRSYMWETLKDVLENKELSLEASDLPLLMARQLANNLSQEVVKDFLEIDNNKINPLEMYLYPSNSRDCNPADIYRKKDDDSLWMVFTPGCDFEQNKAENVLLSKILPITQHPFYLDWQAQKNAFDSLLPEEQAKKGADKALKDARGKVKSLAKNRAGERYKFLPGTFFLPNCIVDFQDLKNRPIDVAEEYELVCSLDNPYREELLHLFSKYYGRIGTPDYDTDPIWNSIDADFNA